MGLTPPLSMASEVWLDLKLTQEKAQLVCMKISFIRQIAEEV